MAYPNVHYFAELHHVNQADGYEMRQCQKGGIHFCSDLTRGKLLHASFSHRGSTLAVEHCTGLLFRVVYCSGPQASPWLKHRGISARPADLTAAQSVPVIIQVARCSIMLSKLKEKTGNLENKKTKNRSGKSRGSRSDRREKASKKEALSRMATACASGGSIFRNREYWERSAFFLLFLYAPKLRTNYHLEESKEEFLKCPGSGTTKGSPVLLPGEKRKRSSR